MGDRAQVAIVQRGDIDRPEPDAVYLYTHWGGYQLAKDVRDALSTPKGRNRSGDSCYLARIILDEMTGLNGAETGYGICTEVHGDIEHALLVVDPDRQMVGVVPLGAGADPIERPWKVAAEMTFDDFRQTTFEDPSDFPIPVPA